VFRRREVLVTLKVLDTLGGELAEDAWTLYADTFRELNKIAVQRHLMNRREFDEVMADPRVAKYLTLDDAGQLVGLSTFTNDLDAVPLISPQYFEAHWPNHYAAKNIWYIGFVAVTPAGRGSGAFTELFAEYYRIAAAVNGIVGLDVCTYNETVHRLPRAIEIYLKRLSGGLSRSTRADQQSFWLHEMNSGGVA
jgi:hypothetical protein